MYDIIKFNEIFFTMKEQIKVLLADDEVKEDFGGISILPTMFLVDQKGKILKKYLGHIERDSLIRDIRQTLEH